MEACSPSSRSTAGTGGQGPQAAREPRNPPHRPQPLRRGPWPMGARGRPRGDSVGQEGDAQRGRRHASRWGAKPSVGLARFPHRARLATAPSFLPRVITTPWGSGRLGLGSPRGVGHHPTTGSDLPLGLGPSWGRRATGGGQASTAPRRVSPRGRGGWDSARSAQLVVPSECCAGPRAPRSKRKPNHEWDDLAWNGCGTSAPVRSAGPPSSPSPKKVERIIAGHQGTNSRATGAEHAGFFCCLGT